MTKKNNKNKGTDNSIYTSRRLNPYNSTSWPTPDFSQQQQNKPFWQNQQFPTTTTPWPVLGQRRRLNPVSSANGPPPWVRPQTSPKPPLWARPRPSENSASGSQGNQSQHFTDFPAEIGVEASDDELREFSEELLKRDVNNAAKYVVVRFQGRTTSRSTKDEAPQR